MKDAYYFSHDSNARNDQRIMKLRMKHGMIGYGIYWAIIEILREQEKYSLNIKDINSIVYELREPEEMILSVIKDFDLFVIKNNVFYSRSLKKRMSLKAEKSDKARESARARWDKTDQTHNNKNANAMRTHSERNAIKESKVKESNIYTSDFIEFWSKYPKKTGKGAAFGAWEKLSKDEKQKIDSALDWQILSDQWLRDSGQYIPNPQTYLNQKRWDDEPIKVKKIKYRDYN
jgi:hypothetical protein